MSIPPPQTSTITRDLRHLFNSVTLQRVLKVPPPQQKLAWKRQKIKIIPEKDRILQWNIVPGDFVRKTPDVKARTADTGTSTSNEDGDRFEVLSVDKVQNKVFLKGTKDETGQPRSLSYAACQLYLGDFYAGKKDRQPVYATRVGCTNLKWNWRNKRFEWLRYAEATLPRVKWYGEKRRVIPWPKEPEQKWRSRSNPFYDTAEEEALEMTWRPYTPGRKVPSILGRQYISELFKPNMSTEWNDSLPLEHALLKELTNPLSRAARQERWQAQAELLESSKEEYVRRELDDLQGRRREDAKRDGLFQWKAAVRKYQRRVRRGRWLRRGGKDQVELRRRRMEARSRNKARRLKVFKLRDGLKNQVVPPSAKRERAGEASAS